MLHTETVSNVYFWVSFLPTHPQQSIKILHTYFINRVNSFPFGTSTFFFQLNFKMYSIQ